MKPYRFFIRKNRISGRSVTMVGPPVWHIRTVLRLVPGDRVVLFSGQGVEHLVRLDDIKKQEILGTITHERRVWRESPLAIRLGICLPKGKILDSLLQKATELGVQTIVPLLSEHSQRGVLRNERFRERWEEIVIDAAAQSERDWYPVLEDPIPLEEYYTRYRTECSVLFHPSGTPLLPLALDPPAQAVDSISACFGPEGGFSQREVDLARDAHWSLRHLGPRVLRLETALVAGISALQLGLGDGNVPYREEEWYVVP